MKEPLCPIENVKNYSEDLKKLSNMLFDNESLKKWGKLFKALSDTNRLKLLKLLKIRPMCVCELMIALEITQPTASHHLGFLKKQD